MLHKGRFKASFWQFSTQTTFPKIWGSKMLLLFSWKLLLQWVWWLFDDTLQFKGTIVGKWIISLSLIILKLLLQVSANMFLCCTTLFFCCFLYVYERKILHGINLHKKVCLFYQQQQKKDVFYVLQPYCLGNKALTAETLKAPFYLNKYSSTDTNKHTYSYLPEKDYSSL